jgi:hypothetical protein
VDWFNPDTWKPAADLVSARRTIAGAGGAMLRPLRWATSKFRRNTEATDRRPLRFVTNDSQSGWSVATLGERLGTHVHGKWHVTNVSDRNVVILKARIEGHETEFFHVFTQAPDQNVFGFEYPILAKHMSEVSADFTFFPSIGSNRNALIADVVFTDNYAEEHRIRSVQFRRIGP